MVYLTVDDFTTEELVAIADSVLQIVNSINRRREDKAVDEEAFCHCGRRRREHPWMGGRLECQTFRPAHR